MATDGFWPPHTVEQLESALRAGLLEETHTLDIKREIGDGKAASRAFAKDVAAFSIDGGVIVIGVEETESGPVLRPLPLNGLPERLEQIALTAVSAPVQIQTTSIPSDDEGNGYLVVHIPFSSSAPHMAGERYYGRGDKTNIVLGDAEVLRHHQLRLSKQRGVKELTLRALEAAPAQRDTGLLCIVADPGASRDLLSGTAASVDWRSEYRKLFQSALTAQQDRYSPTIRMALNPVRRPGGVALPLNLDRARNAEDGHEYAECFLGDDGHLELLSERAIDNIARPGQSPTMGVLEELIVGNAIYVATLAGKVAEQCGYKGPWNLGLVCVGLQGAVSWRNENQIMRAGSSPVYTVDEYIQTTTASTDELVSKPQLVAGDLTLALLRALDSDQAWPEIKR